LTWYFQGTFNFAVVKIYDRKWCKCLFRMFRKRRGFFNIRFFCQLLSAFLIGGIDIWGLSSFFVAFQIVRSPLEREGTKCSNVSFFTFVKAVCTSSFLLSLL
jgi:hypothetical protein